MATFAKGTPVCAASNRAEIGQEAFASHPVRLIHKRILVVP